MVSHSADDEATKGANKRDEPIYTIGTVCRETGLHAATVRTWEDRYATIVPAREQGGRRLYSRNQIDALQWIADQVSSGLQPSEAHRLLRQRRTGGSDEPEGAIVGSLEPGVGGEFLEWIADRREWLTGVLDEVRVRLGARSVDLSANFRHPVFGLTRSTMIRSVPEEHVGDLRLARFVGISWCELAGIRHTLARGETVSIRYEDMDAAAREVFGPTPIRSMTMVPVMVRGSWVGVVESGSDGDGGWSPADVALIQEATEVVAASFTAHHVEAGFGMRSAPTS